VKITNTHAFNAAFAAAQLGARIESSGQISTSEKIAAAAVGMANAEAKGIDWGQVEFDLVCDSVACLIKDKRSTSDSDLEDLCQEVELITRLAGAANARRMTAAPALLATCESVIHECDAIINGGDMSGTSDQGVFIAVKKVLTSAISKAKGCAK
jgi:hypothetical protein